MSAKETGGNHGNNGNGNKRPDELPPVKEAWGPTNDGGREKEAPAKAAKILGIKQSNNDKDKTPPSK